MSDLERIGNILRPYGEKMGLRWQPDLAIAYPCYRSTVITDPERERHFISISPGSAHMIQENRYEGVMTLALARLGEALDPIFAEPLLHPWEDVDDSESRSNKAMLFICQQVTHIWASDIVAAVDVSLIQENTQRWWKWFMDLSGMIPKEVRSSIASAYALNEAQSQRYPLRRPYPNTTTYDKTIEVFGTQGAVFGHVLASSYASLPILPTKREGALWMLEQETRRVALMWNFPITPTLTEFEGRTVWTLVSQGLPL